MNVNPGITDMS